MRIARILSENDCVGIEQLHKRSQAADGSCFHLLADLGELALNAKKPASCRVEEG
jgi:hypothetical protein